MDSYTKYAKIWFEKHDFHNLVTMVKCGAIYDFGDDIVCQLEGVAIGAWELLDGKSWSHMIINTAQKRKDLAIALEKYHFQQKDLQVFNFYEWMFVRDAHNLGLSREKMCEQLSFFHMLDEDDFRVYELAFYYIKAALTLKNYVEECRLPLLDIEELNYDTMEMISIMIEEGIKNESFINNCLSMNYRRFGKELILDDVLDNGWSVTFPKSIKEVYQVASKHNSDVYHFFQPDFEDITDEYVLVFESMDSGLKFAIGCEGKILKHFYTREKGCGNLEDERIVDEVIRLFCQQNDYQRTWDFEREKTLPYLPFQ